MKTWSGFTYDFHGACDLILVKSQNFHKGTGVEIQIRTEIRRDWSFIASTAIKIGGDILEVGGHAKYAINREQGAELTESVQELAKIGGFPVQYFRYGTRRHKFEINIGDKQKIHVKIYNEFLSVGVDDAEAEDFGDATGMMGHFHSGKLLSRGGEEVADYKQFGFEWQVRNTEEEPMLFTEGQFPQFPTQCKMPSPKATSRRLRRRLSEGVSYEEAAKACENWVYEARESCIYDVMSTGDLKMAEWN